MSDLTPNALGQQWVNAGLSRHKMEDYNHPNARFFYVSFGIVSRESGSMGYTSCTSITTYGAQPNLHKLEKDMSENGRYGVTVLNIVEFTKNEFTKFLCDYTPSTEQTLVYPATFQECPETGWFVVKFRDVPGAITQGQTFEEAVDMAQDALQMMLADEETIPTPSNPQLGDVCITVSL